MSSVGQAIGGIIGAVVGFIWGAGPAGAIKGFSIGASLGGMLDPPKGPNQTGPRLTDLSTQTSTYGTAIPRVYGTIATMGNIFWLQGDALTEVATVSKQKSGGKGGGSKSTVTTYSYYATFAVGLCQGPIAGVRRIWIGANLIYDAGSDDPDAIAASNDAAGFFKLYLGTEDQTPDPRMQADKGVANVPAYRGLAYIVFYDYPLKDHGNSLMGAQVKVELIKSGEGKQLQLTSTGLPNYGFTGVAYGNGRFVAINQNNTRAYYSRNGEDWSYATIPVTSGYGATCIAFGLGKFIVGGSDGYIYLSPDGSAWVKVPPPTLGAMWYHALFGNGAFVLLGYYGEVAYSYSGQVWFDGAPTLAGISYAAAYGDGKFVVVGSGNVTACSTNNGLSWINGILPSTYQIYKNSFAFGDGYFVAVLTDGTSARSMDGEHWNAGIMPAAAHWFSLGYGDGVWVAAEFGQRLAVSTDDGLTWSLVTPSLSGTWMAVAHNGFEFLIIGSGGYYLASRDGLVWDEYADGPDPYYCNAILFAAGITVAIGGTIISGRIGIEASTADLADIIAAECALSGLLEPTDIDVSAITGTVRGYRISETGAIRGALEPLQGAFPFDVVQRGYEIAFLPRGGSSVITIDQDALGAVAAGEKPGVRLTSSREMDSQLPRRVAVKYFDSTREYDISEQYAERLNTETINISEVTMPLAMTASEAAGAAETLLYLYWLERYDVSFVLPSAYAYLEPADVITITCDHGSYELRLREINYTSNGLLECRAKYNNSAIYTPTAQGEEGSGTGKPLSPAGASLYVLLDLPCLQDVFDTPGFGAAMCGTATGWPGGVIFRSTDGGQTWIDLQGFADKVPIGFATTALSATARTDIIDTRNRLTVALLAGELFSVTQEQMFNGANYFAIGAHGRWEIVAAQNCVLQSNGSYLLSDFLRGRFGTEWAMSLHAAADTVVLLTDADMAFIACEASALNVARTYRGITNGAAIESDGDLEFTYSGVNLKPLSPVYLNGNRHPSTNDWTLEWLRRTRVDGALRDFVDAALGEASESYEIEIYDGSGYATVKRTITATSQTCAYTSAQQVADFGSNRSTLYVKVYQLSATVGRGYPLTATITR